MSICRITIISIVIIISIIFIIDLILVIIMSFLRIIHDIMFDVTVSLIMFVTMAAL